jgi:hypothetical protein
MNASDGDARRKRRDTVPSLSDQGHRQIMDYLCVAEDSAYPAIRAAALELAKETGNFQRNQGAKLPPRLIMVSATVLVLGAISACWYAFLHYQERLASEISGLVFLFLIIIIALYALLSGYLSQANFMRILQSATSGAKRMLPGFSSKQVSGLQEEDGSDECDEDPPSQEQP